MRFTSKKGCIAGTCKHLLWSSINKNERLTPLSLTPIQVSNMTSYYCTHRCLFLTHSAYQRGNSVREVVDEKRGATDASAVLEVIRQMMQERLNWILHGGGWASATRAARIASDAGRSKEDEDVDVCFTKYLDLPRNTSLFVACVDRWSDARR